MASRRSSSSRTAPDRTANLSASTAPSRPNGPSGRPSSQTATGQLRLHPGLSTTTLDGATQPSEATPPISRHDWHQRDSPVHLAGDKRRASQVFDRLRRHGVSLLVAARASEDWFRVLTSIAQLWGAAPTPRPILVPLSQRTSRPSFREPPEGPRQFSCGDATGSSPPTPRSGGFSSAGGSSARRHRSLLTPPTTPTAVAESSSRPAREGSDDVRADRHGIARPPRLRVRHRDRRRPHGHARRHGAGRHPRRRPSARSARFVAGARLRCRPGTRAVLRRRQAGPVAEG